MMTACGPSPSVVGAGSGGFDGDRVIAIILNEFLKSDSPIAVALVMLMPNRCPGRAT
jgi:hypothetical protein